MLRSGFEDQPRLGLLTVGAAVGDVVCAVGGRFGGIGLVGTGGQRFTDALGFVLIDCGVRAAGTAVEFGQRIEDTPAGGAQHPRQRMDPQLLRLGFPAARILFALGLF